MDEIELREKQLAAMRVDVCSTVALKKLKGCCCVHIITNLYMGLNAILRVFFFYCNHALQKLHDTVPWLIRMLLCEIKYYCSAFLLNICFFR